MDPDQQGDVLHNTRSSFSLSPVVDVVPVNAWLQSDCVSTAWRETGSLKRKSSSSCQRSGCGSTDWAHDACTELRGGGSVALGPCVSKRIWCSFTRCCGDKVASPPLSVFIYLLFLSEKNPECLFFKSLNDITVLHFGDFPLKQQVFHSFPQKSGSGTLNKKYTAWRPHTDTLFSVYCKCCFIFISLLHEAVSHILDGVSKVSNSFLCFCIDVTWSVKSVTTINMWSPNTPREWLMCESASCVEHAAFFRHSCWTKAKTLIRLFQTWPTRQYVTTNVFHTWDQVLVFV